MPDFAGNDAADRWTLCATDRALLGNKSGATRLGFAVLLKLFEAESRFPRRPEDVPLAAVEVLASQVGVPAAAWRGYDWHGRAIRYHRVQIRAALGFREAAEEDAAALARWLDSQVLALERRPDRLLAAARDRCKSLRIRELDRAAEVAVVLADDYPNWSICGLPYFLGVTQHRCYEPQSKLAA